MFISLNKKFIYSIVTFFLLTAALFIYTFYIIYGIRFQEELNSNISRNRHYMEMLRENNTLRKEIYNIVEKYPGIETGDFIKKEVLPQTNNETAIQNKISNEQKRIEELSKSYNDRYLTIKEGIRIVSAGSILIVLSIALLWFLMRRWVLTPLDKLSVVSNNIAHGNLSTRVTQNKQHKFPDEIDYLIETFNNMLDNLENNIREIKEKEKFLQSLIDGIPDGIRVIDNDYNIVIANKKYYQQIGKNKNCVKCYEASQNLDKPCSSALFSCPLQEICKNKKNNIRVVQQFANHPNRHLSINAAPLNINKERLVVEVIRDLSDDIKFSHQQKLSSLGFMATSVAHEMKNHLGSIRMIIERVIEKYHNDKPFDDEEKKLLQLIYNQIIECINVPERLLKLSRFSENELQAINCLSNIEDVAALLDYEAKHNGITVDISAPQKEIYIKGNEADFKMIIINLILNAIKAIKSNGQIKIELLPENKHVLIRVSDNGHGISKENLPRIFEPFYSDGKDNRLGGTGLGLSIVKSIVEKFKGTINVSSEINVGTCFTLKFPHIDKK